MRTLLLSLVLAAPATAGPPAVATGAADPRTAPLDRLMTAFLADHDLPGAALAVARGGRVVYARGFGAADAATGAAVDPDALFRVASLSKPVTAAAVLRLADRGRLKLADRVFDMLGLAEPPAPAAFDRRWRAVTVEHLLHHAGGWDRDETFDPMFASARVVKELGVPPPATPDAVVRFMLARPLQFEPGARFAYSNFGYSLLGRVVEKASGEPYERYVRREELAPLGITRMRLGRTLEGDRLPGEVRYHDRTKTPTGPAVMGPDLGGPVPKPYGAWCLEAMDAHGGWVGSAPDLTRFAAAFAEPAECRVLSADAVRAMFARPPGPPGRAADGTPRERYYGCGWSVVRSTGGRFNYFHTGRLDGTSALLVRRSDGLSWAVLFNGTPADGSNPAARVDPLLHAAVDEVKEWPAAVPGAK